MLRHIFGISLIFGIIAIFVSWQRQEIVEATPLIPGRNNTILFLTTEASGLSNVHIATSSALLENHPETEVHYASFPKLASKISRVSSAALAKNPKIKPIIWHELPYPGFLDKQYEQWVNSEGIVTQTGTKAMKQRARDAARCMVPWAPDQHLDIYNDLADIISKVDPSLIVLDNFMRPGMDLMATINRQHAVLTPSGLVEVLSSKQPWAAMLWKYPASSSGYPFPVPWSLIPKNAYIMVRFIWDLVHSPEIVSKRDFMAERGIETPFNLDLVLNDAPLFLTTIPEAHLPMKMIPSNIKFLGPTVIDMAPAAEQDIELATWMKQAPTILINLGSLFHYNERRATAMADALRIVLSETQSRVIWKFNQIGNYSDDALQGIRNYIHEGRVRLTPWLNADPVSLLKTGDIILSIHHGGANCYNEAVLTGVPQVILPVWHDLYSFATTAEYLGIGVWPGRDVAPEWEAEALAEGILMAIIGQTSVSLRKKAKELSEIAAGYGGRQSAAAEFARMAMITS